MTAGPFYVLAIVLVLLAAASAITAQFLPLRAPPKGQPSNWWATTAGKQGQILVYDPGSPSGWKWVNPEAIK